MYKVDIQSKFCKGCGYCVAFCPKKLLVKGTQRSTKGYFIPEMTDAESCVGCLTCAVVCPESAIEISKEDE